MPEGGSKALTNSEGVESTEALIDIGQAVAGLPIPVQTGFLRVASRLVGGLLAYPAAWLRRPVQGFEDTTNARSIVAHGLANALVEDLKQNPQVMEAVKEAYLPDLVRKITNKAKVVQVAASEIGIEHKRAKNKMPDTDLDEDWINNFIRISEDASSERLQKVLGKLLAGEIINPGRFSKSTLRIISELTKETIEDFAWLYAQSIEGWVYRGENFKVGRDWTRLINLNSAGLVSNMSASTFQPKSVDGSRGTGWHIGRGKGCFLTAYMKKYANAHFPIVNLSKTGVEIGYLLPQPDIELNLRNVARDFPKAHVWKLILMISVGIETSEVVLYESA